jgi:Tachylectin
MANHLLPTNDDPDAIRVMIHTGALASRPEAVPAIPAAPGSFTLRGQSDRFLVYFHDALGPNGAALADALLANCDADFASLQYSFDNYDATEPRFHVFIQPGATGAFHYGSSSGIYVDAFNGADQKLIGHMVVAEAGEIFMGLQRLGWDPRGSNGEALSRVLAEELYPGTADRGAQVSFYTAETWLNSDRSRHYYDATEPSDRNTISIGIGVLFINWLQYQLNYGLRTIIAAGAPTLAQTYTRLTGRTDGFEQFSALLEQYYPAWTPARVANDNPFPLHALPQGFLESKVLQSAEFYQLGTTDDLVWQRHVRWEPSESSWLGPRIVGRGWDKFAQMFGGGANIIYAIDRAGVLFWYRHDASSSGDGLETPGAWARGGVGKAVGESWGSVKSAFSPGGGLIYAVTTDDKLNWYRHRAFETGEGLDVPGAWDNRGLPKEVGHGWGDFTRVFGFVAHTLPGPDGFPAAILYGVMPDGTLRWYRHDHAGTGDGLDEPGAWAAGAGKTANSGWGHVDHIVAGGTAGVIYVVTADSAVQRHVHTGFAAGLTPSEGGWSSPEEVRYGWRALRQLFVLTPGILHPPR